MFRSACFLRLFYRLLVIILAWVCSALSVGELSFVLGRFDVVFVVFQVLVVSIMLIVNFLKILVVLFLLVVVLEF